MNRNTDVNNNENTERCPMCPNHCLKGQTKCGRGAAYFGGENGEDAGEGYRRPADESNYDGRGDYMHGESNEYGRGRYGEHAHGGSRQHGHGDSFHEGRSNRGRGGRRHGEHDGNGDHAERKERGKRRSAGTTDDGWQHSNEPEDTLYGLMRQSGHYLFHRGHGNGAQGQDRILQMLAGYEEGVSQRMLQDRLGIQSGSISEILNKLEDKGFVRRERDPEDQRRVTVRLTEEGSARAAELQQSAGDTDALFEILSEEERAELKTILTKLVRSWLEG